MNRDSVYEAPHYQYGMLLPLKPMTLRYNPHDEGEMGACLAPTQQSCICCTGNFASAEKLRVT